MSSRDVLRSLTGASTTKVAAAAPAADSTLTDPVYVEKLASALDFIHDNFGVLGLDKVAAAMPPHKPAKGPAAEAPVDPKMADKIKASLAERLKQKLKTKEAEAAVQDTEVSKAVLSKLLRMRTEVEAPVAEVAVETPEVEPEIEPAPHSGEVTGKASASLADLSLADVLQGALRANELEEGVSKERSKTASVRGEQGPMARKVAVESLKQGLMAKFGKEA